MPSTGRRFSVRLTSVALAGLVMACQSAIEPTSTPERTSPVGVSSSAARADPNSWSQIPYDAIEQSPEHLAVATDANGSLLPCAECQSGSVTMMTGVAAGPAGLVAVGWISPDFHGATWHSADGQRWTLDGKFPVDSALQAVAADADLFVAVGLDRGSATTWSSVDGLTWKQTASAEAFGSAPLRLTSVTHWSGGFVAAGYVGNEFATARAAFWASTDGLTWQRTPDSPDLADGRVLSITAGGPGLVAVGSSGSNDTPGPAVAWTSRDGLTWSRVPAVSALVGAQMRSIANVPGIGLVAVGEDFAGQRGVVWVSPDGARWTRAPLSADLGPPAHKVQLHAVIAGGPGAVIVGSATETAQSSAAVVWTSPDGLAWTAQKSGLEFSYSELAGVTAWDPGLVAVGDTGIPDEPVAAVWTSPAGWTY